MIEIDLDDLMGKWKSKWPEDLLLKEGLDKQNIVRFYSLPEGKRYPETEAEYEVMLDRHYAVLSDLSPGKSIIVITAEWTDNQAIDLQRQSRPEQISRAPIHWKTLLEDDNPDSRTYRQLFVAEQPWLPHSLDAIFRAVADDKIDGVIIAPKDLSWLYFPYDGGADVILSSTEERDRLANLHRNWLP